ncbi:Gfo/Idh/MocA family protein [Sporohalobacter salinus]|uniref:Gfo/Idh/MocA family protein n=1 Tax=Sporohalobacter salinus TaxID=1494606 RepID=UPI001960A364|nr:Gfo/Idh/MocA family oxidoreductase [Sporohalobacter salinus]MBM7622975.1 putative dehydrogenase [Sporohalobacter salinus]
MKVCFFGLGSIGKKHLKNLCKIAKEKDINLDVHAFRTRKNSLELKGLDKEIYSKKLLEEDYDIIFVTNPTFKHFETIKMMENKTKNMFIEKPIFDNINYDITDIKFENGIYYVAAPLRYTGIVDKLKEIIKDKNVYSIRSICSSYLPDWRPNQDYREVYSAKKELGGGVSIDLIHEWDYLTYLFGFPKRVVNFQGKYSHLEIDSEDLSIYIAEYEDKLLELHLDYFGIRSKREVEIYTKEGTIIGDFIKEEISFTSDEKDKINFLANEDMYIAEMRHFIEMVLDNKNNPNSPEHAYNVLKLIKESEKNESINNNLW